MSYPYIVVEGNIGSGKTSLATLLAADLRGTVVREEFEENSFLPRFYEDRKRFAFPLELSFLASRFNQLRTALDPDIFGTPLIADYGLFKNLVFARVNLEEDEYKLFFRLYEIMSMQIRKPDLVIYLHQGTAGLLENIRKRGRAYEQRMDPAYLEAIGRGYLEYFRQAGYQRVAFIDADAYDFVEYPRDYRRVRDLILKEYPEALPFLC